MSIANAHRIGWLWSVDFARWTSPDDTSLTVHVVAEDVNGALVLALPAARRCWGEDASNLSIRGVSRGTSVNGAVGVDPSAQDTKEGTDGT